MVSVKLSSLQNIEPYYHRCNLECHGSKHCLLVLGQDMKTVSNCWNSSEYIVHRSRSNVRDCRIHVLQKTPLEWFKS